MIAGATLASYRDRHKGETVIVCGCGRSLLDLPRPPAATTIGVNDVGRLFDPTYLVVVNLPDQFAPGRWEHVASSRASGVFTPYDLALPNRVSFRLGARGGTDLAADDALPHTGNSPYVAVCLAAFMGASRIGLIGVDFADDHFFAATGPHGLGLQIEPIDGEYRRLGAALAARGIELVNLSVRSQLTGLPRQDLGSFLAGERVEPAAGATDGADAGGIRAFLHALMGTARELGWPATRSTAGAGALPVVWNGRHLRPGTEALYCEHGWLPRATFQVSYRGINADSHHAPFGWDGAPLDRERRERVQSHLARLRSQETGAGAGAAGAAEPAFDPDGDFLLVPLQVEEDTNITRHAPAGLGRMQGMIDRIAAADPPWPVVFKQHPADLVRGSGQLALVPGRRQDRIRPHLPGDLHRLLAAPGCRGVVAINSNVVHDALVRDVPAIALGRGIWPRGGGIFLDRLPADWRVLEAWRGDAEGRERRLAYVEFLLSIQWTLRDAGDPARVARLLADSGFDRVISEVAVPCLAIAPAPLPRPLPLVNLVVGGGDTLAAALAAAAAASCEAYCRLEVTGRAQSGADAWVFWRTPDAIAPADPERSLVFIHDLEGAGRPEALQPLAGFALSHPALASLLAERGLDLGEKRWLEAIPGAPRDAGPPLTPAPALEGGFTVGWLAADGRADRERERPDLLVEALASGDGALSVLWVGEGLEEPHRRLQAGGVASEVRNAPAGREDRLRALGEVDCVVVTAGPDTRPAALFEALAAGVPVVCGRSPWAESMVVDGENGYLFDDPAEIAPALAAIGADLGRWRSGRQRCADGPRQQPLEDWLAGGIRLAASIARDLEPAADPEPRSRAPVAAGWRRR